MQWRIKLGCQLAGDVKEAQPTCREPLPSTEQLPAQKWLS